MLKTQTPYQPPQTQPETPKKTTQRGLTTRQGHTLLHNDARCVLSISTTEAGAVVGASRPPTAARCFAGSPAPALVHAQSCRMLMGALAFWATPHIPGDK